MRLIEGNINKLPARVHVEQDGNYFFVLTEAREDFGGYVAPLAVLDSETRVAFDLASGKAAQNVIRAFLTSKGIAATFDY